ncbi:hypothetical protein DPMN_031391 [Dreissena polymorpha]|uniref:Uncharacterized protein n=1 Tax=Dreissena polymorpha TaxID=45954 RepID=A0A9D4LZX1_DREPO|nr:hypothetical protein DPMN_031391 [Dreissena polymorpha]
MGFPFTIQDNSDVVSSHQTGHYRRGFLSTYRTLQMGLTLSPNQTLQKGFPLTIPDISHITDGVSFHNTGHYRWGFLSPNQTLQMGFPLTIQDTTDRVSFHN